MKTYHKVTPEGTRDILFEECRALREVQARLSRVFSLRGYHEVMTPGLEYYDVFQTPGMGIPQQEMYKSADNHGRLLVFRPDSTLPIARMAASRLQGHQKPIRLYYNQSVYRNRPDLSGRNDETAQMGVELLGASGLRADLEAVAAAVQALGSCVEDFRFELGHARLFQLFSERLPLSREEVEEIRATIEAKNYAALGELLDPLGDAPAVDAIRHLPRLFGGEEALEAAEEYCTDPETAEVLSYLKTLYAALRRMGLGEKLMVDLGLVQRNDYYSGVVFSAYLHRYGDAVLVGGRYDSLCEAFGEAMPAVGFSVDVEALSPYLEGKEQGPQVLVYGEPGFEVEALRHMEALTRQGIACESATHSTKEEALCYAEQAGLERLLYVSEQTEEIAVTREGKA